METGFKNLRVYNLAYKLAMEIFHMTKSFPREEIYSLTDQIRRSSRSVCANIGEGYRKRIYPKHFANKITNADGECSETLIWLDFSRDCSYITIEKYKELHNKYSEVDRMLGAMILSPEKFIPVKK